MAGDREAPTLEKPPITDTPNKLLYQNAGIMIATLKFSCQLCVVGWRSARRVSLEAAITFHP